MSLRSSLGLGAWLIVCYGGAAIASQFMPGLWYDQLAKPDWTPPDGLFGPVWTLLYGLMAIAAWLVWRDKGLDKGRFALGLFGCQLALNLIWSWLFFGMQEIGLALVDIIFLWLALFLTIVVFRRQNRIAGALLLPYLFWVSFATALNFEIWQLN